MARRVVRDGLAETFKHGAWREEAEVFYRQRKSVWFTLALLIAMSAFWSDPNAWIAFFLVLAAYSALMYVRMGVVCGISFAAWFFAGLRGWAVPGSWENRVIGLWCIATLFLLVVWKADGVHRLRDRRASDADTG